MSRDFKLTQLSQEKGQIFKFLSQGRFSAAGSGTHFVLTQITLHECRHTSWQGRPGVGSITGAGRGDSTPLPAPHGAGAGPGAPDPAARAEAGEGAAIRRQPRGPLPPAPHILCFPPAPGSGSSFCESPRRGGRGAWRSYFRAIREGGRRGRGVEVEAAQKAPCLLLFHPTEGSICGSEQTLGIRAGRGKEKGEKKKKATSTTTHRSSPELPRGGE